MIKPRFLFDVSFSKIILGVAGISASICAFQYFISKNSNVKRSSKIDFLQNIKNFKTDNKVSNTVSATPLVEPGIGKDKLDSNYLKNSIPENDFNLFTNKIKSDAAQVISEKVIDNLTVSDPDFNSNDDKLISKYEHNLAEATSKVDPYFQDLVSKSNLNCGKLFSKTDSKFRKSILNYDSDNTNINDKSPDLLNNESTKTLKKKASLEASHSLEKFSNINDENQSKMTDINIKNSDDRTDLNCKASNLKSDTNCENSVSKTNSNCKILISKTDSECKKLLSNTDSKCKDPVSNFDLDKENMNQKSPEQLTDNKVKNTDSSGANTINLNDSLQTSKEKPKEHIKKKPRKNKFTKLRSNLNQQHNFFEKVLKLVTVEQNEYGKNIDLLETDISVDSLYKEISNRIFAILEDLNKQKSNESSKQLLHNIFNLQLKVWKIASKNLRYKSKLSDERNKNLKGMFDFIKVILGDIEDLFEAMLIRINLMMNESNETNVNTKTIIPNIHEKIENDEVSDCIQKLINTFQEFVEQNRSLEDDISKFPNCIRKLFEKYNDFCSSFYKTFRRD